MPTDRENFDRWFVRPLESLYPREECGFILLNTAFPLLERYLTSATGDRTLNPKFYAALHDLFQQLRDWREAKEFWNTYRNGFLHQSTFNSDTHRGSVIHHQSPVIILDAPTRTFCLGSVEFTQCVLATIVNDFPTYLRGPPLAAVQPAQTWSGGLQPTLGPTPSYGTSTTGPMPPSSPASTVGPMPPSSPFGKKGRP